MLVVLARHRESSGCVRRGGRPDVAVFVEDAVHIPARQETVLNFADVAPIHTQSAADSEVVPDARAPRAPERVLAGMTGEPATMNGGTAQSAWL